jgi:hypothetical protein
MLDRTEIIKLSISRMAEQDLQNNFEYLNKTNWNTNSSEKAFKNDEEFFEFWNENKEKLRK